MHLVRLRWVEGRYYVHLDLVAAQQLVQMHEDGAATASSNSNVQSMDNSSKESTGIEQSTNTTGNTSTTSTSKSGSSKNKEELPQRKLFQGFYAICQSCGFSL